MTLCIGRVSTRSRCGLVLLGVLSASSATSAQAVDSAVEATQEGVERAPPGEGAAPQEASDPQRQHDAPVVDDPAPVVRLQTVIMGIEARRGVDPQLAEALSDVVQGVYARDDSRVVLGTSDIRRVLGFEAQRQAVGCSDDSCLSELAAALDADRLVTGSVDRIGDTWLFVLTEIDARTMVPIVRLEQQLPVSEERLPLAVRELTTSLVRGEPMPVIAPDDGEVPLSHWFFAFSKLGLSACAVPFGGTLLFFGAFDLLIDAEGQPNGAPSFDRTFTDLVLCFIPGAVCCTIGGGLVTWAIIDFVDPPRRATHVIGAADPGASARPLPSATRLAAGESEMFF